MRPQVASRLDRIRCRLTALLERGILTPAERAAAGNTLAQLGDTRFQADAWYLPDEPLLGFVEVPAGPFLMGSDKRRDKDAFDDEQPQHSVELGRYYVARYPVTVAQFRAFVAASGHEPRDPDSLRGIANHPVVWVTWHDAMAYCRWLTEVLQAWEGTPEPLARLLRAPCANGEGWAVRLPTEAEWEKAARGEDGRLFPWGNLPDPNRANYSDAGIGGTSAVGCFPGGASPYGVLDMSGNVWQWSHSLWGKEVGRPDFGPPYAPRDGREDESAGSDVHRVLRGGSFLYASWSVRCAYRNVHYPDFRRGDFGFRLVEEQSKGSTVAAGRF